MNNFFTWEILMTYSGATLAATLVTQFVKDLPFVTKLPTRLVSYIAALVIMVSATLFTEGFTWGSAVMACINAVVVALASNGAFDAMQTQAMHSRKNA